MGKELRETDSGPAVCYVARACEGRVAVVDCGCAVGPERARAFAAALAGALAAHCGRARGVAVLDSVAAPLFRTLDRTRAVPPLARHVASCGALAGAPVPCLECPNVVTGVGAAFLLRAAFTSKAAATASSEGGAKATEGAAQTVLFTSVVETRRVDPESVVALVPCLQWWLGTHALPAPQPERLTPTALERTLAALPWNVPSELFA